MNPFFLSPQTQKSQALQDIQITKNTITSSEPGLVPSENWNEMYQSNNGKLNLKNEYISCEVSVENEIIPFDYLAYILVDPVQVGSISLRDYLWSLIKEIDGVSDSSFQLTEQRLIERKPRDESQTQRMAELVTWSRNLKGRLIEDNEPLVQSLPQALNGWFEQLEDWKKRILASWLTYTYNGTIRLMENEPNSAID